MTEQLAQAARELEALLDSGRVLLNEPLKDHTSFRIGGPADVFVSPAGEEELLSCLRLLAERDVPFLLIGNGSNLLAPDSGCRCVVLQIGKQMGAVRREGNELVCGAGALLSQIAAFAKEEGLAGLEFASGIPGTLGGACIMNAGAYGGEMTDVVTEVRVITKDLLPELRTAADGLCFGYRTSSLMQEGALVTGARIRLSEDSREAIAARMEELRRKRVEKQPLDVPSAGSTFKRPEGYFAGKLIMDAGLRGFRVGDAQVSEKHCGFVVNRGNATAADVTELIRRVQETVEERFGVRLEPEVRILTEEGSLWRNERR